MGLTPLQLFRRLAAEFTPRTSNDDFAEKLEAVTPRFNLVAYGHARYNEALAQAVAHELELEARRERMGSTVGVGPVTGQSGPSGSVNYSTPQSPSDSHGDDYYRLTTHGLAVLEIRDEGCGSFGVFC